MTEQDERKMLIEALFNALVPLSPGADQRETERNGLIRYLMAKNSNWWDCPIEHLRHEVYGNAA